MSVYSKLKITAVVLGLSASALLFQNCGQGFELALQDLESSSTSFALPSLQMTSGPQNYTMATEHSFAAEFISEPEGGTEGVTFHCRLNTLSTYQACDFPHLVSGLTDGAYEISIKAVSEEGESAPVTYTWVQDRQGPDIVFNKQPSAQSGLSQVEIEFTGTDSLSPVNSYLCSFDGATASACSSPLVLNDLTEGNHSLTVSATDAAGNTGAAAMISWEYVIGIPTVMITSQPQMQSNNNSASFTFSGLADTNTIQDFECQLNNGGFNACSSPAVFDNLNDGSYNFQLRGSYGGKTSEIISYNWSIDATAPLINVLSEPAGVIETNSATVTFDVMEDGSGLKSVTCQFDNQAAASCTNSVTYTNIAAGQHTILIRAEDNFGNISIENIVFKYEAPAPALNGELLYTQYCAACHNSIAKTDKRNISLSELKTAISKIGQMKALTVLTEPELQAIVDALN